jgi:hypothetical protein
LNPFGSCTVTIVVARLTVQTICALLAVGCMPGQTVELTIPAQVEQTVTGTLAGERTQVRECV